MLQKTYITVLLAALVIAGTQPTSTHCMSNSDRIMFSAALVAGGLGLKSLSQHDRSTSTYRLGAIMNFFGLTDLMFGSDNPISRTDPIIRWCAFAYYYLESSPQEKRDPKRSSDNSDNDVIITIHQQ